MNYVELFTRIPEGRTVEGLEYGAHYQAPDRSWSGYYVRAGTCPHWGIARQTPASDELEESDAATVRAIAEELEAFALDQSRGVVAAMAGRRVTMAEEDHARIVDLTQALQTVQAIRRDVDGGEYEPAQADMAEQLANAADVLTDEIGRRLVQDQIRR